MPAAGKIEVGLHRFFITRLTGIRECVVCKFSAAFGSLVQWDREDFLDIVGLGAHGHLPVCIRGNNVMGLVRVALRVPANSRLVEEPLQEREELTDARRKDWLALCFSSRFSRLWQVYFET